MEKTAALAREKVRLELFRIFFDAREKDYERKIRELTTLELSQLNDHIEQEHQRQYGDINGNKDDQEWIRKRMADALKAIQTAYNNVAFPYDHSFTKRSWDTEKQDFIVNAFVRGKEFEIQVLASISANVANLFHPLIQWALSSTLPAAQVVSAPFHGFEKKLFSAIQKGIVGFFEGSALNRVAAYSRLRPFDKKYLQHVYNLLSSEGLWEKGNDEMAQNERWLSYVSSRLKSELPEYDHELLLSFLRAEEFPKSPRYDAFANALNRFAYNKRKSKTTYKKELHLSKKNVLIAFNAKEEGELQEILAPITQLTEDDLEPHVRSWMAAFTGSQIISDEKQIVAAQGLVWRELTDTENNQKKGNSTPD